MRRWQEKRQFVPWMQTIPTFEVPRAAKYEEIVVPSVDSAASLPNSTKD